MQPNDPNKTNEVDNEADSLPNQANETVPTTPGAPELPGSAADDSSQSVDETPTAVTDTETSMGSEKATDGTATDAPQPPAAETQDAKGDGVTTEASTTDASQPAPIVPPAGAKKSRKKFALLAAIAAVLILGGGAGAYFGIYLPSQPENIWKSAMTNSGKVYDEAVTFATKDREQKAMKLEGSYDLDGAVESDGKINGEWKGLDGKVNGELSAAGLKIGFDARSIKATDDSSDLYLKLTGLQGLGTLIGGGEIGEVVNGINNQWFVIDHTLIEQAASAGGEEYSREDIAALMEKADGPTKEYLFSSDQQKAVFVVKQQVGSEKKEGRNTYHFKVGFNNDNFGRYVEALCNAVKDDKIGKELLKNEKKNCTDLGKEAAKQKTDETADVWVDKRTKLPHVVRVSDPKSADNWIEVGQDYQGGDEFPTTLKLRSKENKQNIEVDLKALVNIKTDATTMDGTFSFKGSSAQNVSGKVSLKIAPTNSSSVKVDKPENAKSIIELLNSLGLGDLIGGLRGNSGNMTVPSTLEIDDLPQSVQ